MFANRKDRPAARHCGRFPAAASSPPRSQCGALCPCGAQVGARLQGSWKSPSGLKGPENRSHSGLRWDSGRSERPSWDWAGGLTKEPLESAATSHVQPRQGNRGNMIQQSKRMGTSFPICPSAKVASSNSAIPPPQQLNVRMPATSPRMKTSNTEVRGYGHWLVLPDRGPKSLRQEVQHLID